MNEEKIRQLWEEWSKSDSTIFHDWLIDKFFKEQDDNRILKASVDELKWVIKELRSRQKEMQDNFCFKDCENYTPSTIVESRETCASYKRVFGGEKK